MYDRPMLTKSEVIQHHGTTAAQFARDIGATKQQVHNWGERIPAHWALRVSKVTGLRVEQLLDDSVGNGSPSPAIRDSA